MKKVCSTDIVGFLITFSLLLFSCASVPVKKYYVINYEPVPLRNRLTSSPYPCAIRIKEFSIEEAYSRPQIVYRKSPFELQYYFYRAWAVKPTKMITDVVHNHLSSTRLVSHVVRRFDEGLKPDYELTGTIEALEEYDNEDVWWAHLSIRFELTRLKDRRNMYNRSFDQRKRVFQYSPEYVVRELSQIMDYIMSQVLHDIDVVLAREYGFSESLQQEKDSVSNGTKDSLSLGETID